MSLPTPRPGLVIRYAFLWSLEAAAGREEAAKDRPCAIVLATKRTTEGWVRTLVAPITHQPPQDTAASLAIPADVAAALGLDAGPHWIRFDELNEFGWPGFDLRPLPGQPGRYDYGMLPRGLFEQLRLAILAHQRAARRAPLRRD